MSTQQRWLLPDGVEEILPAKARALEALRQRLLLSLESRGYQPVMPPLMEYIESLLTGAGEDLDTQTFKVPDPSSQRTLGIRADLTPQIARIDAHYLREPEINRLCYVGSVLRTRSQYPGGSRELLQIGAELFGEADTRADCEIVETMLAVLAESGIDALTVGLGHVGIYREIMQATGLNGELSGAVFDIFNRKSIPDMERLLQAHAGAGLRPLRELLELRGGIETIAEARRSLPHTAAIEKALTELERVCAFVAAMPSKLDIHIDLAELRGYKYHTGLTYQAYIPGRGHAIAQGGRYDRVGEAFGRARPATGFSANLKSLVEYAAMPSNARQVVFAPPDNDAGLLGEIRRLRAAGKVVIVRMPGESVTRETHPGVQILESRDGVWTLDDA